MQVSTPTTEGKLMHPAVFPPFLEWIPASTKKYYNDYLSKSRTTRLDPWDS